METRDDAAPAISGSDEAPARARRGPTAWRSPAALAAYVALVLFMTLSPMPWAAAQVTQPEGGVLDPHTWLDPVTWSSGSPRELLLNVLLFVPVGFLAARVWPHVGLVVPLLLTLQIEIAQISMPDRASDPRDLAANVTGGAVGAALGRRPRVRRQR